MARMSMSMSMSMSKNLGRPMVQPRGPRTKGRKSRQQGEGTNFPCQTAKVTDADFWGEGVQEGVQAMSPIRSK